MALAGAVQPDDTDPLAEQHLGVERVGQTFELETLDRDDAFAGARAPEAHRDVLHRRPRRRWLALEPLDAVLRRAHARRERVAAHLRAAPELGQRLRQPLLLLGVAAVQFVEARDPGVARLVVAGEAAAVRPAAAGLDRHDLVRDPREQLAVVAHEQNRLRRRRRSSLRATPCRARRGSCRARRARGRRHRSGRAPRARGASARRPRASRAAGRRPRGTANRARATCRRPTTPRPRTRPRRPMPHAPARAACPRGRSHRRRPPSRPRPARAPRRVVPAAPGRRAGRAPSRRRARGAGA